MRPFMVTCRQQRGTALIFALGVMAITTGLAIALLWRTHNTLFYTQALQSMLKQHSVLQAANIRASALLNAPPTSWPMTEDFTIDPYHITLLLYPAEKPAGGMWQETKIEAKTTMHVYTLWVPNQNGGTSFKIAYQSIGAPGS